MKTGNICIICNSNTTSNEWYKHEDGYICGKCYMNNRLRESGKFQNFKEKMKERICIKCNSNETRTFINKNGYECHQWHSSKDGWLCNKCFYNKKDTFIKCVKCNKEFRTNWLNKINTTTKLCKECRKTEYKSHTWLGNNFIEPVNKFTSPNNLDNTEKKYLLPISDKIHCAICNSNITRVSKNKPTSVHPEGERYWKWYNTENGKICAKCYDRLYKSKFPEKAKLQNKKRNSNRLKYKEKYVRVKELVKTGECEWCPNNVYDGSCKHTQLHHKENKYNDEDFLDEVTELCPSCHRKETIRLAKLEAKNK